MRYRFQVADLNAIETRVGAWLAECHDLMQVFEPYTDQFGHFHRNGRDPYISFATKMYGGSYDVLYADKEGKNGKERKSDAKAKRQIAKPGVLGAIYRLSGGELVNVYDPKDPLQERVLYTKKTGLWAYADNMGVEMSQEQAHEVVRIFRDSYPEICNTDKNKGPLGIWKRLEEAVADVMHPDHPQTVRYIGPNRAVKIDRINLVGRHPIMRMQLPSGRYLHYIDAHLAPTKMTWTQLDEDGEEVPVYKDALIYAGTNQKTKQWENNIHTHGGKLFENLVQAIARDILGVKLLDFEAADMPVIGHVHDEGICLVVDDLLSGTVEDMVEIMSKSVSWAPGLLLGADGYEEAYYHK
jgi:DNA polymerase bacteriophage-type